LAVIIIIQLLSFYLIKTRQLLKKMIREYFPTNEERQKYPEFIQKTILLLLFAWNFIALSIFPQFSGPFWGLVGKPGHFREEFPNQG